MGEKETVEKHIQQLRRIIAHRNIRVKMIVSLPRANSTIVELVLANSPDVSGVFHELFINFGYYHQSIIDDINALQADIEHFAENSTVILKEMSHWITDVGLYKHLLTLVDTPVILQYRHPTDVAESKIKKMLISASSKKRQELNAILCSQLQEEGTGSDTSELLERYAQKCGYDSWHDCRESMVQRSDYRDAEPIARYFSEKEKSDVWGWLDMETVRSYVQKKRIPYVMLNGTVFRSQPLETTQSLCKALGITYADSMLRLNTSTLRDRLGRGQAQPGLGLWYDTALSHESVLPPRIREHDATPIFPDAVSQYLHKDALPLYKEYVNDINNISRQ